MVFPETEKVVAYLPNTGGGTGLLNAFSSVDFAALVLSYVDVYPATDWPELPGGGHGRAGADGSSTVSHAIDWTDYH
jgi:hypothetical protein